VLGKQVGCTFFRTKLRCWCTDAGISNAAPSGDTAEIRLCTVGRGANRLLVGVIEFYNYNFERVWGATVIKGCEIHQIEGVQDPGDASLSSLSRYI
jgi:hypothetical protein